MSKSKGPVPDEFIITKADERAIAEGYYWCQAEVDRVLDWFKLIRLTSGRFAGQPMELMPFQREMLSRCFGWRMPDGRRRHRVVHWEIPKKTSKSTTLAALALMMILEEPSAEVYNGAVDGTQASYLFDAACKMIKASPGFDRVFKINHHRKIISCPGNFGRMEVLTSEANSKDGFSSSFTIFDETHRWGSDQRLYDVMKEAGAARDNPLLFMITTAGDDTSTFAKGWHDRARAVIAGDDGDDLAFLPIIYGASPDDDIDDPATWYKAVPSLGHITRESDFRQSLAEAKRNPTELAKFRRLRLNIWGRGYDGWIDSAKWKTGDFPEIRDLERWKGRGVIVGIDLAKGTNDLTALSMATLADGDVWVRSHCFMPADNITFLSEAHSVDYGTWADQGYIERTPGNLIDYDAIIDHLVMLRKSGIRIEQVVVDNWYSPPLQSLLTKKGFKFATFPQIISYFALPCVTFEQRLTAGRLKHCASPLAEMCIVNARTNSDRAGNYMLDKGRDPNKKIDLAVSAVMATGVLTSRNNGTPQVY